MKTGKFFRLNYTAAIKVLIASEIPIVRRKCIVFITLKVKEFQSPSMSKKKY